MTRTMRWLWLFLLPILVLHASPVSGGPDISCDQVHAAARIARAKSSKALAEERKKVRDGYILDIVSAFRAFELRPNRQTASSILLQIPSDESQQAVILALDSAMCDEGDPRPDMDVLAPIKYRLPRVLARAVELVPEYMGAYVRYALKAAPNPHTDYAVQMASVCRKWHSEFVQAVESLPDSDRDWFVRSIFDPKQCRAIAVPESE